MTTLMNLREASDYLGKSQQIIRRMVFGNVIRSQRGANNMLLFEVNELDRIKAMAYPEGMSHSDIAARYGQTRSSVIYQFGKLKVRPLGRNRGGNNRSVYHEDTVTKMAKILDWEATEVAPTAENPPNGS